MSNVNEGSDFATFFRLYKQWESGNQRLESLPPQQSAGAQHPASQAQRPQSRRLSPARFRPQPSQQALPRNTALEFSTFFRVFDEIKKRQDDMCVALNGLQNMLEQIKVTVEENMARMHGNMERFEVIGRGVLELALQPSNSHPPNGSSSQPQTSSNPPQLNQHTSQQQTSSNPPKPYGQTPNVTQPSAPFGPSSNPSQLLYGPPSAQAPEPYSDSYMDYAALEFLTSDTS